MFINNITRPAPQYEDTPYPNYLRLLDLIAGGDLQIREWLEDLSGYICTGATFQNEVYWLYGLGLGKSVLGAFWHAILGGYADITYNDHFTKRRHHLEIDFRLNNKRMLLINEVDHKRLSAARLVPYIYHLPIKCRPMYGKLIEIIPSPKILLISTQASMPAKTVANADFAKALRVLRIEKNVSWDNRDPMLLEKKLMPEAPYVLSRMMKRAQKVLVNGGFETPEVIKRMSEEVLNQNSIVRR